MRSLSFCLALFALAVITTATAQTGPRLTGSAVIAELKDAQQKLDTRIQLHPDEPLKTVSQRLAQWQEALKKSLGTDAAQPVDLMGDARRAQAMRAHAAAMRTAALMDSCTHCLDGDAAVMAQALALTVDRLADARDAPSAPPPVVESVETPDRRAIFAVRSGEGDKHLVLAGRNLADAQCADPQVSATDEKGTPSAVQPTVTNAQPGRIELTLPAGSGLTPGSYVLHVKSQRKAFLVGCVAQPEALGVLQIAPAPRFAVTYTLDARCSPQPGGEPAKTGSLPALTAYGATQVAQVEPDACPTPVGYTLSAQVTYADGSQAGISPIAQPADAAITAGLPGGLSLQWNPAVRQLVLRSAANACTGFY
ncbi:hypothetical protein [Dyella japonica]|uniref:IPT/TIG domain-containing protein n=1 Tax=Dyella japonica A8 TaxID=1217721 RepID=A0A075K1H6_9GAMM|nr:hypothetical protein [Dyella japonica]AIF48216.1 hypothetical protein HY57_13625 [Dyella japonica A8]